MIANKVFYVVSKRSVGKLCDSFLLRPRLGRNAHRLLFALITSAVSLTPVAAQHQNDRRDVNQQSVIEEIEAQGFRLIDDKYLLWANYFLVLPKLIHEGASE